MKTILRKPLNETQMKRIYSRSITNNLNIILEKLIDKAKELVTKKRKYSQELININNNREVMNIINKTIESQKKYFNHLSEPERLFEPR